MMKLFSVADSAEILKLSQRSSVDKDEANKENEVGVIFYLKQFEFGLFSLLFLSVVYLLSVSIQTTLVSDCRLCSHYGKFSVRTR